MLPSDWFCPSLRIPSSQTPRDSGLDVQVDSPLLRAGFQCLRSKAWDPIRVERLPLTMHFLLGRGGGETLFLSIFFVWGGGGGLKARILNVRVA